jgi:AAA family ATP:ADP antiporter
MDRLRRLLQIETAEIGAVAWSFLYFFAVLASYYVVRPLRDEMSVAVGPDGLKHLFLVVFLVMLAAVPVFGWVVATFPRQRVAPVVYMFFIANLAVFWVLLSAGAPGFWLAAAFFVWVSVFNLFVVSLFWSVMADIWTAHDAKRVYGLIAAGGSLGAFTGPLLTQSLVHALGVANMLLVSAALLGLALAAVAGLRRAIGRVEAEDAGAANHGSAATVMIDGARRVFSSPYLAGIAAWITVANLISTYFYAEQARIVGAVIATPADRVQLFARMDLAVSVLTIAAQLLVTGKVLRRIGVGLAMAALPASAIVGLVALAAVPTLAVLVVVIVAERAIQFALANPAMRVLYTSAEPEAKYSAQNFIDTVVFRGADAASAWLFNGLKGLGLGAGAVAVVTLPFAVAWLVASVMLGRMQEKRERDRGAPGI